MIDDDKHALTPRMCNFDSGVVSYTLFTRSSKHRADIKQAWWNPAPWFKCR